MKIGIDTLFTVPDAQGSIADYLAKLVETLGRLDAEDRFFLFVSPRNLSLFNRPAGANFVFINCYVSNERPVLRILAQQVLIPYYVWRHRIRVLFSPADVAPLLVPSRLVLKINTLHHFYTPDALGRLRTFYRQVMIGASARRADAVVANSNQTKADICQLLPVRPEKVSVILEAVDERFEVVENRQWLKERLRTRFGVDRDYVLFASSLYRYKNLSTLLEAFALLCRDGSWTTDLLVVGPDPHGYRAEMEGLAEDLGIARRVRFMGFVPNFEMRELYCGAQALVYPSLAETFGKPLVEAMRCGTPVVAAKAGAIPEILGGAGLLVEPLDPAGMAKAILQVVIDRNTRKRLVERGMERAKEFSWETAARATVYACHKVCDEYPDAEP